MTREEKVEKVKAVDDGMLLECLINWAMTFNPCDPDKCENYEVVKAEILRRMGGKS